MCLYAFEVEASIINEYGILYGVVTAKDVTKPAVNPITRPATVERICFNVEAFLVKAIGIASPARAPPPAIKREVVFLFLISSSEEFSVTYFWILGAASIISR